MLRLVRFAALYGRCIVFFYIVSFLFVHECGDVRHEKMHDEMHDEKMHDIQISRFVAERKFSVEYKSEKCSS